MSRFRFHPGAHEAINRRAAHLLESFKDIHPQELGLGSNSPSLGKFPAFQITEEEIIGPLEIELNNPVTGEVLVVAIDTGTGLKALRGADCSQLDELINEVAKPAAISSRVGRPFLRSSIKCWLRARLTSKITDDLGPHIEKAIEAAVRQLTIWVPIASLHVESHFRIGDVLFQAITREKLEEWLEQFKSAATQEAVANLEAGFQKDRLELQGLAAAVTTVVAEDELGIRLALERADVATSLLRIFHVSNLGPRVCSYCRPLGMEHVQKFQAYLESSQGLGRQRGIKENNSGPWIIDANRLGEYRRCGLDHLDRLLSTNTMNDFQERLLSSLLVYSKNSLAKQPIEKLIFILVALESLLLKDERESIQQNIGERLAFAVSRKPEERKRIVDVTHQCYSYRSKFLHHGRDEHQIDLLTEFMKLAWIFLLKLVKRHDQYETKDDLIRSLEEIKFA